MSHNPNRVNDEILPLLLILNKGNGSLHLILYAKVEVAVEVEVRVAQAFPTLRECLRHFHFARTLRELCANARYGKSNLQPNLFAPFRTCVFNSCNVYCQLYSQLARILNVRRRCCVERIQLGMFRYVYCAKYIQLVGKQLNSNSRFVLLYVYIYIYSQPIYNIILQGGGGQNGTFLGHF